MPRTSFTLEQVVSFLLDTPMFEDLSTSELSEVVGVLQVQCMRDGGVIFREGEPGDGWYLVWEGRIEVTRSSELGPTRSIEILGPHASFGETSVIDGQPRGVTARSVGETTLLRIPRREFERLLEEDSLAAYKLALAMARVVCRWHRQTMAELADAAVERDAMASAVRDRLEPLVPGLPPGE
ncbi:MAG: cyclic nucleotide-binding domain-containing protein [Deltaproteobacteria bacterium]|nr:cyclic nucleotide-binding domain-containing protein [Deltaproteobacteria bacterium]